MNMKEAKDTLVELRDKVIDPLLAECVDDPQEILNKLVFEGERYKEALTFALGGIGIGGRTIC